MDIRDVKDKRQTLDKTDVKDTQYLFIRTKFIRMPTIRLFKKIENNIRL